MLLNYFKYINGQSISIFISFYLKPRNRYSFGFIKQESINLNYVSSYKYLYSKQNSGDNSIKIKIVQIQVRNLFFLGTSQVCSRCRVQFFANQAVDLMEVSKDAILFGAEDAVIFQKQQRLPGNVQKTSVLQLYPMIFQGWWDTGILIWVGLMQVCTLLPLLSLRTINYTLKKNLCMIE